MRVYMYVLLIYQTNWGKEISCFPNEVNTFYNAGAWTLESIYYMTLNSQGHNFYKLKYISLEEVKIVPFQQ